jgi:hypothetical protein
MICFKFKTHTCTWSISLPYSAKCPFTGNIRQQGSNSFYQLHVFWLLIFSLHDIHKTLSMTTCKTSVRYLQNQNIDLCQIALSEEEIYIRIREVWKGLTLSKEISDKTKSHWISRFYITPNQLNKMQWTDYAETRIENSSQASLHSQTSVLLMILNSHVQRSYGLSAEHF